MFLSLKNTACLAVLAISVSALPFVPAYAQMDDITKEEVLAPIGDAPAAEAPAEAPNATIELQPLEPLEPVADVPVPAIDELASPVVETPETETMPSIPDAAEVDGFDENIFFDAESLVPSGEMGRKSGPRKVNPQLEPGSKLIISTKESKADSKAAQLVAADRAMKLGRYESALEIYDQLYAKNNSDANILMGRATTLQQLGQDEMALQAYEEFLDRYPQNAAAKVNMLGLMGKKYPSVALRQLLEMHDEYPGDVGMVAQIAVMQAKLARFDEAIRYLGIAASMQPKNASHLFNMAVIADRAGSKKEAIQYYEEALEIDTLYGAGRSIPREAVFERLALLR